jgi:hypothetical protein
VAREVCRPMVKIVTRCPFSGSHPASGTHSSQRAARRTRPNRQDPTAGPRRFLVPAFWRSEKLARAMQYRAQRGALLQVAVLLAGCHLVLGDDISRDPATVLDFKPVRFGPGAAPRCC